MAWRSRCSEILSTPHTTHRLLTNIVWTILTLLLAGWGGYFFYQHDQAIHSAITAGQAQQLDILPDWAVLHGEALTLQTSLPPSHPIDSTRELNHPTHSGFELSAQVGAVRVITQWQLQLEEELATVTPNNATGKLSEISNNDLFRYTVPIPDACTTCHRNTRLSYSVRHATHAEHYNIESAMFIAGYLVLLTAGILISRINHHKLTSISHAGQRFEHELQRQYESQTALSGVLKLAISSIPIGNKLQGVLEIVTGLSWLRELSRGAIFTRHGEKLVMSAQKGIDLETRERCRHIGFGECICGTAATSSQIQLTPHIYEHDKTLACTREPHSHYCVPIFHEEKLLGLLSLYVELEHQESEEERAFLSAIGHALGNMLYKNQIEAQLIYDAGHDQLTGLGNRTLLAERVNNRIRRERRDTDTGFALLFLDLDRFKYINDSLGHYIGDRILLEMANRLRELLREYDTIVRLGGDEFAILLEHLDEPESVHIICARIHTAIEQNIRIDTYDLHITCSIGITHYHDGYSSFEEMLRDADIAMYRAKSSESDKTATFNQYMHKSALNIMTIESELRYACTHGELVTYFQPIYSRSKNRFIGAEALIRWVKNGIIIPPAEFIGIAEETGLITLIGEQVLHHSCQLIAQLDATGLSDEFYISVNVSAKQMFDRKLVETLDGIMAHYATPVHRLRLEITESLFADHSPQVNDSLNKIKERGIKLLIDDFGTGYSSLSFLHNHPFDCVKIDRSFIAKLSDPTTRQRAQKLVTTMLKLAANLDMSVIAEGVEEVEQLQFLQQAGCDLIQGYLFSEPIDAQHFIHTMLSQSMPEELVEEV